MQATAVAIWKRAPFIRLIVPLTTGIIMQWHLQFPVFYLIVFFISALVLSGFTLLKQNFPGFRFILINSTAISLLLFFFGALLVWRQDVRHQSNWIGHHYQDSSFVLVTLSEPLIEKTKSYKAEATVTALQKNNEWQNVAGKIIVYFKKDSAVAHLSYGSQIIFKTNLQLIKNAGNPGGFDFKRYSLFAGITHQVYLKENDFEVLKEKKENKFSKFLFTAKERILTVLRTNIKSDKEQGLAEALLIGYKNDLDKTLVQSYSNTGVVHVIAISGLHLGLIYWLLLKLLKPLQKIKRGRWLRPLLIIACLWLFSLLAGAQPSVLRSAVMFTCIVLGETYSKRTSIYNTLALSAFILLCINPFWLWDVGFQLSYVAVLSIVIFMQPIYNWFYIKNKVLDFIWRLNAVTLAAQILTIPLTIYHFHQFPNYFLLTNFIAVPLSSLILLAEIFLCIISFIPVLAAATGKLLSWLIYIMNSYVEKVEALPFALYDGLYVTIVQTVFIIAVITGISVWLLEKKKVGLKIGLAALIIFTGLRSYSFWQINHQKKIIVYNVPQHRAIDFIDGRKYFFFGDSSLMADDFLRNFHIKPARILNRIEPVDKLNTLVVNDDFVQYGSKNILLINDNTKFESLSQKLPVDAVIVSQNPKLYITNLANTFDIKKIVFDGSVPAWKMKYWIKDCDSLHIPYHNVAEKGAFEMSVN
jgi:competence protein ComEC